MPSKKPYSYSSPRTTYSDKKKYEAVALYKLVGSLNTVSGMLHIPYETLRNWFISDWWKDYELDIIQENRAKSNTKVAKIAQKAMEVVEDRLNSGDFQLDQKTGRLVRIPVKAEVANRILQDSLNRELLNEKLNQETKKALSDEKMADRLLKIQESFKAIKHGRALPSLTMSLTSTNPDTYEVIEGEPNESINP